MKTEEAIAAGTVLLTDGELALRIGLGGGPTGRRKVRSRARLGLIPCYRPNGRIFLFHWPTVMASLADRGARRK